MIIKRIFILVFAFLIIDKLILLGAYGTEIKPPLDIGLTIIEGRPSLGNTITIALDFTIKKDYRFISNVPKAIVTFQAKNPERQEAKNLEIQGEKSVVIENVPINVNQRIKVPVKISDTGKAMIVAGVRVFDDKDKFLFGNSVSLYFIIFTDEVLVGRSNFIEIEIKKIKEDYQRGLISEEEFNRRMKDLSRGSPTIEIR